MSDIFPITQFQPNNSHQDCGYTWSISTGGAYNLLSGITTSPYYRNCYALINITTGIGQVFFKKDPKNKAAVTVNGILSDNTVALAESFNDNVPDFPALMEFNDCLSDCQKTAQITVTFPNDTEASDIQLIHIGYSTNVNYSTPNALATLFSAYYQGLGFRTIVKGGTLIVQYMPNVGDKVTNGIEILDSTVFTVLGFGAPYPYILDTNYIENEICCDDDCYNWPLPIGHRFAGFAWVNDSWDWEGPARMNYTECNCGAILQEESYAPVVIPLIDGRVLAAYDFSMNLARKCNYSFNLYMLSHDNNNPYSDPINMITPNNAYGSGKINFGRLIGTSGDDIIGLVPGGGWNVSQNSAYIGNNKVSNVGVGLSAGAGASGLLFYVNLDLNEETAQQYSVQIFFYAKDTLPADPHVKVHVQGATINFDYDAQCSFANQMYFVGSVFTAQQGLSLVSIGIKLHDGNGNDLPSTTGNNNYVVCFVRLNRFFPTQQSVFKGHSATFSNQNNCNIKDFLHKNVQLENGFPGHLLGGWDIAFPIELNEFKSSIKTQDTKYVTSSGRHIQLNSRSDWEESYNTKWMAKNQVQFVALAFGLTPFELDYEDFALQSVEIEKLQGRKLYKADITITKDGWNVNRNLC
jgi:hypothetical protein